MPRARLIDHRLWDITREVLQRGDGADFDVARTRFVKDWAQADHEFGGECRAEERVGDLLLAARLAGTLHHHGEVLGGRVRVGVDV